MTWLATTFVVEYSTPDTCHSLSLARNQLLTRRLFYRKPPCNGRGRVATVALQGRGSRGPVPPALAMLPALQPPQRGGAARARAAARPRLGVNNLPGSIPVELGRLGALQGDASLLLDLLTLLPYSAVDCNYNAGCSLTKKKVD
jgi:hypothetical protein